MAIIIWKRNNYDKVRENGTLLWNVNGIVALENSLVVSQKVKHRIALWPRRNENMSTQKLTYEYL